MSRQLQPASDGDRIVVTGVGLMTPVGHDSIMACAAVWAGISRLVGIEDFVTENDARTAGGVVTGVTDGLGGKQRLLSLAVPAAREALFAAEEFSEDLRLAEGKLFLSLGPPERPDVEDFDKETLAVFLEETGLQEICSVEIIREGNSGGILALSKAIELLREGTVKVCVVGGVDSLVEDPTLTWLEEAGRLKTDDRAQGFSTGEAAGFLVIEKVSAARQRGAPALCEVLEALHVAEEAHLFSDRPMLGRGLARAVNDLLATREMKTDGIDLIICDLNGEHFRMKEWGLAQGRIFDGSAPLPEIRHPAENIGDVGAASATVLVAMGATALNQRLFEGRNMLVWASSDAGGRGCALLGPPPNYESSDGHA
jgi:3-oxoacyl-[acyl-carrier-protein] synthase-1